MLINICMTTYISINLQPFTSYSGRKLQLFPYHFAFNAHVGGVPIGIPGKKFGLQKTRIMGLPGSEDSLTIG